MKTATLEPPVDTLDLQFHPDPILSPAVNDARDLAVLRDLDAPRQITRDRTVDKAFVEPFIGD